MTFWTTPQVLTHDKQVGDRLNHTESHSRITGSDNVFKPHLTSRSAHDRAVPSFESTSVVCMSLFSPQVVVEPPYSENSLKMSFIQSWSSQVRLIWESMISWFLNLTEKDQSDVSDPNIHLLTFFFSVRCWNSGDGKCRTEHKWKSVLPHSGTDPVAGWEAHDFWKSERRDGSAEPDRDGRDKWTRSARRRYQNHQN